MVVKKRDGSAELLRVQREWERDGAPAVVSYDEGGRRQMTVKYPAAWPRGVRDAKTTHMCAHYASATVRSTSTRSTLPAFLGGGAPGLGRPVAAGGFINSNPLPLWPQLSFLATIRGRHAIWGDSDIFFIPEPPRCGFAVGCRGKRPDALHHIPAIDDRLSRLALCNRGVGPLSKRALRPCRSSPRPASPSYPTSLTP